MFIFSFIWNKRVTLWVSFKWPITTGQLTGFHRLTPAMMIIKIVAVYIYEPFVADLW